MSRLLACTTLLAVLLLAASALALPKEGQPFPDTRLTAPDTQAGADYLGLPKGATSFRIQDVAAPYVLIQLFNVYCMHCMAEAPDMERLFRAVGGKEMAGKLKILAVGMGNTPFEVKLFREKYALTMPMSTDKDYAMHSLMGSPGTPSYVLVRNPGVKGGAATVLFVQEGRFESPEKFLDLLKSRMKE